MPELTTDGLDVSAAEERYLRRSFRRFALPYVALLMVFAWWVSSDAPAGADPELLDAVRAELVELRAAVEELGGQVAEADRRAAAAAKLAAELDGREEGASAGELAAVQRDLRRASSRLAALEQQVEQTPASQRFDALTDRIARLERQLEAATARPSAPASPAPAAGPGTPAGDIP